MCLPDWLQSLYLPATRLPWYAMGVRSADRRNLNELLAAGSSVGICPGGVQEVLFMERGERVAPMRQH